jgi:pimeloyl-ACP methyl ester carboxylesterase
MERQTDCENQPGSRRAFLVAGVEPSTSQPSRPFQKAPEERGQPIVFHGWPLCSDDWDAQMLFFVQCGHRVIGVDRRGHGRSSRVSDGHEHGPLRRQRGCGRRTFGSPQHRPEYLKERYGLPPNLLPNIAVIETLAAKAGE